MSSKNEDFQKIAKAFSLNFLQNMKFAKIKSAKFRDLGVSRKFLPAKAFAFKVDVTWPLCDRGKHAFVIFRFFKHMSMNFQYCFVKSKYQSSRWPGHATQRPELSPDLLLIYQLSTLVVESPKWPEFLRPISRLFYGFVRECAILFSRTFHKNKWK